MPGNLTLTISRALLDRMFAHCLASYPDEGCGAILGERRGGAKIVTEVALLRNNAGQSSGNRFEANSDDVLTLIRRERQTGIEVLGFFHSHPDHPAAPSKTDRDAAWPEYSYPIVSVIAGEVSSWNSWRLRDDGSGYDEEVVKVVD